VEIIDIFGPRSHPGEPISVKFRVAKRTHVPLGLAKFHMNRCNESPLRGENVDFWLVSKFNTGFAASQHPAGKKQCLTRALHV